jgi:hypothetical protein
VFTSGGSLQSYLIPMAVVVGVMLLRNLRPRRLRIEILWLWPVIYMVLLVAALSAAPPPVTPVSISLLVLGFVLGVAIGWQRGSFTNLDIHPDTHDLTSRASPIGLIFIFAILALRIVLRGVLTENAAVLGVPVVAAGEALLVLAVAMLSTARLELWLRARRMLAEAQGASGPPKIVT